MGAKPRSPRVISEIVESVYVLTMADDHFPLVSVQDPDRERTKDDPGIGLYVADDGGLGEFMPCWLVAEDDDGNWTVVTDDGEVISYPSDKAQKEA